MRICAPPRSDPRQPGRAAVDMQSGRPKGQRAASPRRRTIEGVVCPRCASEAIYRYGRTKSGKKRFLCQACRRQFTLNPSVRLSPAERPACPACGEPMHVYMRESETIRFRCSRYPNCRTFFKRAVREG